MIRIAAPVLFATLLASTAVAELEHGVAELFDPAALARNSCGERGEVKGESLQLIADTAPPADSKIPIFSGLDRKSTRLNSSH